MTREMTQEEIDYRARSIGPVLVFNAAGQLVSTIGGDEINQHTGTDKALSITGVPYGTLCISHTATTMEECQDIGQDKVLKAFATAIEEIVSDEDFWSIEWRVRPVLEYSEIRDEDAVIIDKRTGEQRKGTEILCRVGVRCRMVVHKHSNRPSAAGFSCTPEGESVQI